MQRCDDAWQLYNSWCDICCQLLTAKPQEVMKLKTLSAYLESELRSHLRTCRICQSMINQFVEVSNEYQKIGTTAGQSCDAVDLRPETVSVTR